MLINVQMCFKKQILLGNATWESEKECTKETNAHVQALRMTLYFCAEWLGPAESGNENRNTGTAVELPMAAET